MASLRAYLPLIVVLVLMLAGSSWQMVWTTSDVSRYQCYALSFWFGSGGRTLAPRIDCSFLPQSSFPPFHLLPIEYPPLTLVIFTLPVLGPPAFYPLLFALLMALTALLIYWLLLRFAPGGSALAFALYLLLGEWGLALLRFDLVPALLTLVCIIAAERRRWTLAYVALAFAVLIKIYPLLLLPLLFINEQRDLGRLERYLPGNGVAFLRRLRELLAALLGWRWGNLLLCCGLLLGITGVFALVDFQGAVASQLAYFMQRPVQIESTGSLFIWPGRLLGLPVRVVYTFGSINVLSPLTPLVSSASSAALVLGYLVVLWQSWRGRMDLAQAALAALLVFIAAGKVFSPQYLIWLLPLLAYLTATRRFWLLVFGVIAALTSLIYPVLYTRVADATHVSQVMGFIEIVGLRNALFLLLTVAYLFDLGGIRRREALASA